MEGDYCGGCDSDNYINTIAMKKKAPETTQELKIAIINLICSFAKEHGIALSAMNLKIEKDGSITGASWRYKNKDEKGKWV